MTSEREVGRFLARVAAKAFGGEPHVDRYYDEAESRFIDVLSCADRPAEEYSTYSTLGLHRTANLMEGVDIRVEVAGVAPTQATAFPNMLATAAFYVMKDGWLCAPGVVFPNLVREYDLSSTVEHVLWTPPFAWEELSAVEVDGDTAVHWLQAVPISEGERRLLVEHGFDVLESLFVEHEVEYFDLERPSLV